MSVVAALVLGMALGAAAVVVLRELRRRRPRRRVDARPGAGRVMLPFGAGGLSEAALRAALRLAGSQRDVLIPTALVVVPRRLAPDAPLPRQAEHAVQALEAVELEAALAGVAVDARIERGRTLRHALVEALEHEPAARVVVSAAGRASTQQHQPGFGPDDVAWLLGRVSCEVIVLRSALSEADHPAELQEPAA